MIVKNAVSQCRIFQHFFVKCAITPIFIHLSTSHICSFHFLFWKLRVRYVCVFSTVLVHLLLTCHIYRHSFYLSNKSKCLDTVKHHVNATLSLDHTLISIFFHFVDWVVKNYVKFFAKNIFKWRNRNYRFTKPWSKNKIVYMNYRQIDDGIDIIFLIL